MRRCSVCGSDDFRPRYRPVHSPGVVGRCQDCGFIYVSVIDYAEAIIDDHPVIGENRDMLTAHDLSLLKGHWEEPLLQEKEAELPALRMNASLALDAIEGFVRTGRLLDFGCGGGFFLSVAKERGWEPFGLEPLPGHALYARAHFGANVLADVLREDTFPPEFFDAVTSFQVFEHLPDPAGVLNNLVTALKPGGLMLIEVPNIDTWSVRWLGKRHRHFVPDHLNFFSKRTLSRLMEREGLEVLSVTRPARYMTLRHLNTWIDRKINPRVASALSRRGLSLNTKIVSLNIGDILAVIARKPEG